MNFAGGIFRYGSGKGIWVPLSDEQWQLIKQYAKAKRDYEVGKGYTMKDVLKELVDTSLNALEEAEFEDREGNRVDWKKLQTR